MLFNFEDLKKKEIICVKDGYKIGYVDDLVIDSDSYTIKSFICYGKNSFLGLFKKTQDIVISCDKIEIIGEDIILIKDYDKNSFEHRKKNKLLSLFFED